MVLLRMYRELTFAIRDRKKLLTRNLYRSSSVWITMRAKLVFGSMSPVISSTFSIWDLMRALTRSNKPSLGHLQSIRNSHVHEKQGQFTQEAQGLIFRQSRGASKLAGRVSH